MNIFQNKLETILGGLMTTIMADIMRRADVNVN